VIDNVRAAAVMLRKHGSDLDGDDIKELLEVVDPSELAQAIMDLGAPFSPREAQILSMVAGNMDGDTDFERDGDLWADDVLDLYAQYLHNYEYQYNDESLKVDPNIDTNETHIGIMAQDLEKVVPAAVKEDPKSGYKTVDTGRLALANAGAIAELARRVEVLSG
jgi:hypothetical protein